LTDEIIGVVHVAVSSDGQYVAAASGDTGVYVFTEGTLLWHDRPKTGEGIKSIVISSNGEYVAAGQDDETNTGRATVYLYAARNGTQLWSYDTRGLVWSVDVSSNGSYIVAGSWDHNVYLFSKDSGKPLWNYQARDGFRSVAISSDGQYIAAAGYSGLYMFNRDSGEPMWNYSQYGAFSTVAISSDGQYVAAGSSGDYSVLLLRRDGAVLWRNPTKGEPLSVAISSDGQYVVAGSGVPANDVRLFTRDNSHIWTYPVGEPVESIAISSDDRYIMTGSADNIARLFRRDNENPIWSKHFNNVVWSVALSSNGQSIAIGAAGYVYAYGISLSPIPFYAGALIGVVDLSAVAILAWIHFPAARYLWLCLKRGSFRNAVFGTLAVAGYVSGFSGSIWRIIVHALGITPVLTAGLTLIFCPFIVLLLFPKRSQHTAISAGLGSVFAIGMISGAISVLALVGAI